MQNNTHLTGCQTELKGYILPKNTVFRYAFFPYGVLFGAFVALHLEPQQETQLHFLHFFCTSQHPHFAPLWCHFPSVRQMVFNASFNGVQKVSCAVATGAAASR